MKKIELSILIVNYNTAQLLKNCLQSIYHAIQFGKLTTQSEVIIVDNASNDNSVEILNKVFPQVHLILNKENLGFAKANNQAIKKAKGKYILLLNSDTKVDKSSLIKLLSMAKEKKEIGVVGGRLLNSDGTFQQSMGFFPNLPQVFFWMSFLDDLSFLSTLLRPYHITNKDFYQKSQFVDWVSGACMLVKKGTIEKVGLLDEAIFMYGEEVEWCYRIKQAGFQVVYIPDAKIIHFRGESSGEKFNAGIIAEFKSILYFYRKHKSLFQQHLVRIILKFGALLRILLFGIIIKHPKKANLYAKAYQLVG